MCNETNNKLERGRLRMTIEYYDELRVIEMNGDALIVDIFNKLAGYILEALSVRDSYEFELKQKEEVDAKTQNN